jgi:hypothetical protein
MPKRFGHHANEPELEEEFNGLWAQGDGLVEQIADTQSSLEGLAARVADLEGEGDGNGTTPGGLRIRHWAAVIEISQTVVPGQTYTWPWILGLSSSQAYTHGPIALVIAAIGDATPSQVHWRIGGARAALTPWPDEQGNHARVTWGEWALVQFNRSREGLYYPDPVWLGPTTASDWLYFPISSADAARQERFTLALTFRNESRTHWHLSASISGVYYEHAPRLFQRRIY